MGSGRPATGNRGKSESPAFKAHLKMEKEKPSVT
jgi:hypothetical protein